MGETQDRNIGHIPFGYDSAASAAARRAVPQQPGPQEHGRPRLPAGEQLLQAVVAPEGQEQDEEEQQEPEPVPVEEGADHVCLLC
jgi:hypothetical protein